MHSVGDSLCFHARSLFAAQFSAEELRDQTPSLLGEVRVVTIAIRHCESVPRAMKEVPVQGLPVRLKTCH